MPVTRGFGRSRTSLKAQIFYLGQRDSSLASLRHAKIVRVKSWFGDRPGPGQRGWKVLKPVHVLQYLGALSPG